MTPLSARTLLIVVVSTLMLSACSDDAPNDPAFASTDLEYAVGDKLVYRTTQSIQGEESISQLDTQTVTAVSVQNGIQDVMWDDGTMWRISSDTFYVGNATDPTSLVAFGMVPAPTGRWTVPIYTFERTAEDGTILGTWYCIYITTSADHNVTTPAGTFRCATVSFHFEDETGFTVETLGSGSISYAPGIGLVHWLTNGTGIVNGETRPSQRVVELYQIFKG